MTNTTHTTTAPIPLIDLEAFANLPKQGVIALDFTAAWCGPCKAMRPVLAAVAGEYARDVRMVEVDVEDQPALAEQFAVRAMPTFVILRDGREVGRFVGSRPRGFVRGVLDRALAGDVAIAAP
jgi:thioredoxin